tara:strand:- start:3070 stop:3462 length:393 start_codon:yes stop_codon:yes gene_type:complete
MLIFIPKSKLTQFFVNSIIIPLLLAGAACYVIYKSILLEVPLLDFFDLYFGLDNIYTIFSTESFLLVFWLHFVTLNIFLGSWMARDGVKYNVSRGIMLIPLILTYFTGPIGLVVYWFIRVFFAKRLSFHD